MLKVSFLTYLFFQLFHLSYSTEAVLVKIEKIEQSLALSSSRSYPEDWLSENIKSAWSNASERTQDYLDKLEVYGINDPISEATINIYYKQAADVWDGIWVMSFQKPYFSGSASVNVSFLYRTPQSIWSDYPKPILVQPYIEAIHSSMPSDRLRSLFSNHAPLSKILESLEGSWQLFSYAEVTKDSKLKYKILPHSSPKINLFFQGKEDFLTWKMKVESKVNGLGFKSNVGKVIITIGHLGDQVLQLSGSEFLDYPSGEDAFKILLTLDYILLANDGLVLRFQRPHTYVDYARTFIKVHKSHLD